MLFILINHAAIPHPTRNDRKVRATSTISHNSQGNGDYSPVKKFTRVRATSPEFDQVRRFLFLSLFRVFELSCFRDQSSFAFLEPLNQQEDHENTKE